MCYILCIRTCVCVWEWKCMYVSFTKQIIVKSVKVLSRMPKRLEKSAKRTSMTRETKSLLGRGGVHEWTMLVSSEGKTYKSKREIMSLLVHASVQWGEDLQGKTGDHVHAHRRRAYTNKRKGNCDHVILLLTARKDVYFVAIRRRLWRRVPRRDSIEDSC